jgi:hypothetical protein
MGTKDRTTTPGTATVTTIGVPYQSAARAMALGDQIIAGDHDRDLDRIEGMAKSRRTYDRRAHHLQTPVPAGMGAKAHVVAQIQHGYISEDGGRDAMDLVLEAVAARRRYLRNQALTAKQAELAAAKPDLAKGDRVRVRIDAPANGPSSVLLGNHGTVDRVLQARAAVRFDPDQPLGKFANQPPTRVPIEWLEILTPATDPAGVLDAIARTLNANPDWTPDTLSQIADQVRFSGREVS